MIKGRFKKSAAGILSAAMILTACNTLSLLHADYENSDIVSEKDGYGADLTAQSEPAAEDTPTEESSEEETQTQDDETETEPVTEETASTPSESEPPIPDETTLPSTTPSTGNFFVPTEPPSTAAPIIIILVDPGYEPPDDTTTETPVSSEPVSYETTAPVPEQTNAADKVLNVNKYIRASENVPSVKILTDGEELLNAVVDPFEQSELPDGSQVDVILSVQNTDSLSDSVKELIKAAADSETDNKYSVAEYLDISLLTSIQDEEFGISEAYKEITLTVEIPQNIKDPSCTYGLIRLHNGTAALLKDLDSDPDTITVKTDRFSVYAIVYTKDKGDVNIKTANRLDCLNIFLSVTSIAVILCSFVTLYALWNRKNGKSSKSK